MAIYEVNNTPTIEKIENYDRKKEVYYRFQCKDWEMGTKSWGMIYSTPEEAIEDGSTVLDGKSCCRIANELYRFKNEFDNDFHVLVVKGWYVEEGHDGEDVVDIEEILEIWGYDDFIKTVKEIREME